MCHVVYIHSAVAHCYSINTLFLHPNLCEILMAIIKAQATVAQAQVLAVWYDVWNGSIMKIIAMKNCQKGNIS